MAKESLKFTPLLGQWMLLSGAVFVDRGNSKQAMESLDRAGRDMKERSVSAEWRISPLSSCCAAVRGTDGSPCVDLLGIAVDIPRGDAHAL